MTVKERLKSPRLALMSAAALWEKPKLRQTVDCMLKFILGFAMSCSVVMTNLAPFGIGMVASAGADAAGICCYAGAVLAYILVGGFNWGKIGRAHV